MYRAMRFLVLAAILWCGLHLSPAEADQGPGLDGSEWVLHDGSGDDCFGDREAPHAAHAGHSHCPVAADDHGGFLLSPPPPIKAVLFADKAKVLMSRPQAPPVEPPLT